MYTKLHKTLNFFTAMRDVSLIIKELMLYKKVIKKVDFADFLGISKGLLASWETRNSLNIETIKAAMPEISEYWLLTGQGEMLETPRIEQVEEAQKPTDIDSITDVVPEEIVEAIKEVAKVEAKEELIAEVSVPMVSENVSVAPNIDLKAYVEDNGDEMEQFNVGDLLKSVKVGERITSSSMSPDLNNGDFVFLRFIDKDTMISGKIYYLELKGLPRMARLVKFEGDMLRLKASNPKYDDIVIERDRVKNVARIVCSMRFNFDSLYSDMDELRKHKDEQIISMINAQTEQAKGFIEQLDKFNERENKLMDMLVKNFGK